MSRDENAIERFMRVIPTDPEQRKAFIERFNGPRVWIPPTVRAQLIAEATERGWPIQETK